MLCLLAPNLLLRLRKLTHWMRFVVDYRLAIHFSDSGNSLVTQRNLHIGYNWLLLSIDVIRFLAEIILMPSENMSAQLMGAIVFASVRQGVGVWQVSDLENKPILFVGWQKQKNIKKLIISRGNCNPASVCLSAWQQQNTKTRTRRTHTCAKLQSHKGELAEFTTPKMCN